MSAIRELTAQELGSDEKSGPYVSAERPDSASAEQGGSAGRKAGSIYTIVGSALANLSDGYQQSLASPTNVVFNHLLGTKVYTSAKQTRISNALLVGSVIGIVVFGYLADRFSRKGGSTLKQNSSLFLL